jgi:hypothetical protein
MARGVDGGGGRGSDELTELIPVGYSILAQDIELTELKGKVLSDIFQVYTQSSLMPSLMLGKLYVINEEKRKWRE